MPQQDEFRGPTVSAQTEQAGTNPLSRYFFNLPPSELIAALKKRSQNRWSSLNARGVPNLWRLIYAQAFGMDPNTGRNSTQSLQFCGPQANYIRFRVQLTRGLIKRRNQLAAGQRVSYRAVAQNNNSSTLAQVQIAAKAIDYVIREAQAEKAMLGGLEADGYFGDGYVWQRWDADAGDTETVTVQEPAVDQFTGEPIVDPMTNTPVTQPKQIKKRSGAPVYVVVYPWNVNKEQNVAKSPWFEVREARSKYELIAKFPEHAEALERLTLKRDTEAGSLEMFLWDYSSVTDDVLIVKHAYHVDDASVPGGRYIGYVEGMNEELWDTACPLPNGKSPLTRICSAEYFDTGIGYPESADVLSQQEAFDELISQWLTNVLKLGNQNMFGEDGIEFDPQAFAKGGQYFTLKPEQKPPQVVTFQEIPASTNALLELLPKLMSDTTGMNETIMGDPGKNITSGVFGALMQSIAEQFVSPQQQAFDFAVTDVGNNTLELIRANASESFLVRIAGESQIPYMRAFGKQQLDGVHSVYVERQSPVMNSIGGRFEVFEKTVNLPKDLRKSAVHMLKTGDDSGWTEYDDSCVILIKRENELMSQGIPAEVSKTDDPILHCQEHRASLDRIRMQEVQPGTPEEQQRAAAMQAHIQHIGEHSVVWMQTDPVFAAACGLPPPPMPAPGMGFQPHPATLGSVKPPPGSPPQQADKQAQSQAAPQLPAGPQKDPAAAAAGAPKDGAKPKPQQQPPSNGPQGEAA